MWEVATVLQLNSRCLSFGGGKGLTGTAPVDPHCGEGGCGCPGVDRSPVALGSTGVHEVWVKQVIPHRGPTPLTEIPLAGKRLAVRLQSKLAESPTRFPL